MFKQMMKWFLWVAFFVLLFQTRSMANISQAEHDALMDLYNSTGGANWTHHDNWGGALGTENTWYGVFTDAGNTMVLEINLESNNLQGQLPSTLNNLTNLTKLDLANNWGGLTGDIPDLSGLTNLQYLDLTDSYTLNAGPIPDWILNAIHLRHLGLNYTNRNGVIPTQLSNLINLQYLDLSWNSFNGVIPSQLNNLTNLQYLDLSWNAFTGNIPDLSPLIGLQYLDLSDNNFTAAPLPDWIKNDITLTHLGLRSCHINGDFPDLSNLINLQYLDLTYGDFTPAPLPDWIKNKSNFTHLGVRRCNLTGDFPDLSALTNLRYLDLGRNSFNAGPIPEWIRNDVNLFYLGLSLCNRTGNIPDLSTLTNLEDLDISSNNFNAGPIPGWIFNLTKLTILSLSDTNRTGDIPYEICNLNNLNYLYLDWNQLTTIPESIGNLTNLNELRLSSNQIVSLPSTIGNLSNLQYLELNDNLISGQIPTWLSNLTQLNFLELSRNQFSGPIPPEVGNLTSLQDLFLDGNHITSIPPEIGNLTKLYYLFLDYNQITSLPSEIGNLANLQYLYLCGNAIVGEVPSTLLNLQNLADGNGLDIRWNGLYSSNANLIEFLNQKQGCGDWQSTQTVAPTNVTAGSPTANSITVSWTPISYTSDSGGYKVYYSTLSGGPYTLKGITSDKTISSMVIDGLSSGTKYYFVVQSVTNPHANNQNTVESGFSAEVSATTIYVCPQIVIYPNSFPDGVRMKPYNQTLVSNNGTSPYTYSITSGRLPNGLNLNSSTGVISGTPSLLGTSSFTLKVLDAMGCTSSRSYSIIINTSASLPPPVPDGSFGNALTMTRLTNDGSQIAFNYDTNSCRANAYSICYGSLSSVSSCTFSGSVCSIDTDGTYDWTSVPAGNLFFIIVSNNGNGTEGSWGKNFINGTHNERGGTTPSNLCSNTLHSNDGICE